MRICIIAAAAAAAMAMAGSAVASEELAKSSGCLNCHQKDVKKVGPAIKDIAAKYKGKADAEATILPKLMSAKGHPKVKSNEADTKAIVAWMLK